MGTSKDRSRPYRLSLAVVCTLLASGGFVAAGYSDVSAADAAAALSVKNVQRVSDTSSITIGAASNNLDLANFDPVAAGAVGVRMSFANMLVQARKPAPERVFDLTDPTANTPHLAQELKAMRANVPEISTEQMSQVRRDILTAAYMGLGHHYVWGGTSFSSGWDCSGFVQWAYAQAGIGLPRTEQWLPMVETDNPQPGDLVVQNPDGPNHWSHIGIYIGNGRMISALNPSVGTILHTPGAVSNSSAYFTMPAFAAADELAAKKAKESAQATKTKTGEKTEPASSSATPSTTAPGTTPATKPATKPATTKPATTPGTKPPATKAPTTKPAATTPPTTTPATTPPAPTAPTTTAPATTKPSATPPPTTAPATSASAANPAPTTSPSATTTESPTATPSAESAAATTDPALEADTATMKSSLAGTESQSAGPTDDPAATPNAAPTTALPSQ